MTDARPKRRARYPPWLAFVVAVTVGVMAIEVAKWRYGLSSLEARAIGGMVFFVVLLWMRHLKTAD